MKLMFSYLDPATGTLIVSAIVGGFAAAAMMIKRFWYKIVSFFGGSRDPQPQEAPSDES
ncbi:MAG: hypothetical protein ACR2N7_06580 [Acidimicrobiia bacterium]